MLDDYLCIDFEASALAPGSYPIELGVADPATAAFRSWLIRPTPEWRMGGLWSPEAAAIHGITRDQLDQSGLPPAEVMAGFVAMADGRLLLSDNPSFDWDWLEKLADEAGRLALLEHLRIADVAVIAGELAAGQGLDPERAWDEALARTAGRFPHRHRAGADARQIAEALRAIAAAG